MSSSGETPAPPVLPGWRHVYSGKVRDLYVPESGPSPALPHLRQDLGTEPAGAVAQARDHASDGGQDDDVILVVASDKISAYDHVLPTPIPDKGRVLTRMSLWWFGQLAGVVENHVVSTDVPEAVAGRAMICRRLEMYPVECVARGYLTGSGLAEYRESGTVTGIALPPGLRDGDRLPEPIFTPATKAELGAHDENIDFTRMSEIVGPGRAAELRETTLAVFSRATALAERAGILLADTKLEFGALPGGPGVVLGDEVLTPDSSRFWPAETWAPGGPQASFDKQYVRDWLTSPASGWDRASDTPPPPLPEEVIERTRARYIEAYERLTGERF